MPICLESWRAGIANERFKIYLLVKHKPASLLWLTGPILFLVLYIYMFVLITIFISPLIMFRSDKGSQSNKGRSPYLIGQIRARALPSQIRPILVR